MDKAIAKADVLIEALPYIQEFRGATIVVKFGGSAMEERRNFESILTDVTFMECVGMLPVIVHGGGKAISRAMTEAGLAPKFVKGLRVTDEATIRVVEDVITHKVNTGICAALEAPGARARRIDGDTVFQVETRAAIDEATGETLDWGYVGEIKHVDIEPVRAFVSAGLFPVITPLRMSSSTSRMCRVESSEVSSLRSRSRPGTSDRKASLRALRARAMAAAASSALRL